MAGKPNIVHNGIEIKLESKVTYLSFLLDGTMQAEPMALKST